MVARFITSIEIKASQETVFKVLCDLENYPHWHPSIKSIHGNMHKGQWLIAYFGKGKRSVKIPLELSVLEKNTILEWQGSLFKQGKARKLFLVRHAFYIEVLNTGVIKFINEEEFSPLLSLLVKRMEEKFIRGYQQVNQALKNYCEALESDESNQELA